MISSIMKKIFYLLILISLSSCRFQYDSLKGNYDPGTKIFHSSLSFDQVWNKVLDFFSGKTIPLEVIDKNNGLIFSETVCFTENCTQETGDGRLKNPDAFIVCNRLHKGKKSDYYPEIVSGNYNIRILPEGGKTEIIIELVNLSAFKSIKGTYNDGTYSNTNTMSFYTKSTGVLEKKIADYLQ
jgi:hypothetical protein